jgi:hypothetical protein
MSSYIKTIFPSPISSSFKPAFTDASEFWNNVILRGSGGFTFSSTTNAARFCGVDFEYKAGEKINGLDIFAVVEPIDGPGSILGAAGPCALVGNFPILGIMRFDSADAQGLLNGGSFGEVIVHEMGHVIGIGTLWSSLVRNPCPTNTNRPCTTNPTYVGRNGLDGYADIGGTGSLPVANTGGAGTLNGHWRESFFVNELMTGFLNSGTRNPLSIMTVKSLLDLGYATNINSAEPYFIPSEFQRPVRSEEVEMVGDTLIFELRQLEELELEQVVIEETSGDSSLKALFVFMFIGFLALGFLMDHFQRKQNKKLAELMSSSANQKLPSYLPTRK